MLKLLKAAWLPVIAQFFAVATALAGTQAIVGASVVDIDSGKALQDAVVLIENERISAIGESSELQVPQGSEVIDASGLWLVPGLMNMHVHLGLILPGKMEAELAKESAESRSLRMMLNAQGALEAGVTTIRLPGEHAHGDMAVRAAINRGDYVGPRIFSAGEYLAITGGHGSEAGKTFADGPYELIKKARQEISRGATWVKILISGGIATDGGGIAQPLMTTEEITAVVDAAHRFGAKVAAHSGSSIATDVAVDAGVDSIEHGYFLDRKILRKMKKQGTWLVPTIVVSQPASEPFFTRIGSPDWYLERRNSTGKQHWEMLKTAIDEGVNIALGTDQMPQEPNDGTTATAREAQYYVEAGMSPLEALQAATIEPARMLGADADIGSVSVGKYADIVALSSDPREDIKALRDIRLVMKGGEVFVNKIAQ
uniref:Amidohydrolase n=1 Tax=Vibrio vulnificus TaxID=672 RepID=A0A1W6ARG7_VIBVL|nr:amidohydrolase family protein [Vibrio vulnificus]ARJ33727.1 amidohydrolase [Vibrio vulnificus]